ncbi:MAG: hypothetical protein K2J03_06010 [Muribaculaceae bacterium]|nr:hypothetical protein [Muribaculaceae bacterium]
MEIKIAGVLRASAYSPNHIGHDAAILNAAADALRKRGCKVNIYSEEQFVSMDVEEDIILDMCRGEKAIEKLQSLEEEGRLVINSGFGVENCTREHMTRLLLNNGISYPESLMVNTNENVRPQLEEMGITSCWIKRADGHSMHKEDVTYCRHLEEAQEVIHEYCYRGIKRAVVNRHLEGDLIKFYGIQGQPFFYWFYPFEKHHSKFGDEDINGRPEHLKFDLESLKEMCEKASRLMDVKIYGGDCIIDKDGKISIIDFNDWPSFAPCRAEAAPYIAKCVMQNIREWHKKREA